MYFATHLVKRCLRKAPIDSITLSLWHEPATGVGLHFTSQAPRKWHSNLYAYISYGAAKQTPARRATRVSVYGCRDGSGQVALDPRLLEVAADESLVFPMMVKNVVSTANP